MLDPHELYQLTDDLPDLGQPVLIQALTGFVDAGNASRLAREHLLTSLDARTIATFDVDQLFDYRSRRPVMTFVEDHWEDYDDPSWPCTCCTTTTRPRSSCSPARSRTCSGSGSSTAVSAVVARLDVRLTVGLNSIPMAVPHTRPTGVTAHATRRELISGYEPWLQRVQVPGSVGHLLEYRLGQAGRDALGFAAHVPHYVAQTEYPAAAEVLLSSVSRSTGLLLPNDEPALRRRSGPGARSTGRSPRPTRPPHWSPPWRSSTTRSPADGARRTCSPPRPARCPPPTSWAPSWSASSPSRPDPATPRAPDPPVRRRRRSPTRDAATRVPPGGSAHRRSPDGRAESRPGGFAGTPGSGADSRPAGVAGLAGRPGGAGRDAAGWAHAPGDLERELGQGPAAPAAGLARRHRRPTWSACRRPSAADGAFPVAEVGELGYEVASHGDGRWNGVAILSRVGLTDVTRRIPRRTRLSASPEARAIAATCGGVRVWSVYVPNGRTPDDPHYAYKLAWLAALRDALAAGGGRRRAAGGLRRLQRRPDRRRRLGPGASSPAPPTSPRPSGPPWPRCATSGSATWCPRR